MVSSLLSLVYLLEVPLKAFFSEPDQPLEHDGVHEAPLPILIAMGVTAAATIGLFLYPEPIYRLVALVAGS